MEPAPVRIDDRVADSDREFVRRGLDEYNSRHMPESPSVPIEFLLRDPAGRVCGGILAAARWHWLVVHTLWIEDEMRGQGWGAQLLQRVEETARARGCRFALLDTAEFQAVDFYRGQGYDTFGLLNDNPPGSATHYMVKRLAD